MFTYVKVNVIINEKGGQEMLDSIEKIVNILFMLVSTLALLKALRKKEDKDD